MFRLKLELIYKILKLKKDLNYIMFRLKQEVKKYLEGAYENLNYIMFRLKLHKFYFFYFHHYLFKLHYV